MNRRMRSLHRSLGAIVTLFVLMLATTGILLNHTSDLKLDKQYLTWEWLLEHYGINNVEADSVYLLGTKVISQFGQQVFVDAKPIVQVQQPIIGAVSLGTLMILATNDAFILLGSGGEFIERMGATTGIPADIQNIGLFHGEPVIQTGNGLWRSDFMLEQWEKVFLQGVGWSAAQAMPDSVEKELASYFHGKGVSVERLVLDLHNGHIFGQYGVWLLDLLAGLLIMLSLTGIWMWLHRQRYAN